MKRKEVRYWLHNLELMDNEISTTVKRIETLQDLNHNMIKVPQLDTIPNNSGYICGNEYIIVNRLDFIIKLQAKLNRLINLKIAITDVINSYRILDEYRYQILWHKYINKISSDKGYTKLTYAEIAKLLYREEKSIMDIEVTIIDEIISQYYKQKNKPQ